MISDDFVGIKISEDQAAAINAHMDDVVDQIMITAESSDELIAGAIYASEILRDKIEAIKDRLDKALNDIEDLSPEKVFYLMTGDFNVEYSAPTKEEAIAYAKGKNLESYKIVEEIIQ